MLYQKFFKKQCYWVIRLCFVELAVLSCICILIQFSKSINSASAPAWKEDVAEIIMT